MSGFAPRAELWLHEGRHFAVATVIATRRSAPRPVGTRMAVTADGQVAGAVSGGCVEGAVVREAQAVLGGAPPRLLHFGIAGEESCDVGLPCGGEIDVLVAPFSGREQHERASKLREARRRGVLATVIDSPSRTGIGKSLLLEDDGSRAGSTGDAGLDRVLLALAAETLGEGACGVRSSGEVTAFCEPVEPPPRLLMVGAVDYAVELAWLASRAGWLTCVIDPRPAFAGAGDFSGAEVVAAWPDKAFERFGLDEDSYVLALSHDPKIDDIALIAALRSPARFVGAMGSRLATADRRRRLLEAGLRDHEIDDIAAPVGLDLGAGGTAETAVSIFAEVLAVRNGRDGRRLGAATGRIHVAS